MREDFNGRRGSIPNDNAGFGKLSKNNGKLNHFHSKFPGSGNTWMRYMIERATGYYTGAIGNDGTLYRGGFLGEFEDSEAGTTILVKTHRPIIRAKAAVLLIRNPFNAILVKASRYFIGHIIYYSYGIRIIPHKLCTR